MSKTHILTLTALIAMTCVAASQWLRNHSLSETNTALQKQISVLSAAPLPTPAPGEERRRSGNPPDAAPAASAPAPVAANGNPSDPGRAEREARFREMRTMERTQRIDARLLALRTKLNLTPDQETTLRAAMEKGSADREALRQSMWNRPPAENPEAEERRRREDGEKFAASDAAQEEAVTTAMSPEQLTAYGEYRTEQRQQEVETRANQQLGDLQGRLSLTEEQKESAFQYFAQQAQSFDPREVMAQGGDMRAAFEAQQKAQLEAMSRILTAEQYGLYSKQEEQRAAMWRNAAPPPGGF